MKNILLIVCFALLTFTTKAQLNDTGSGSRLPVIYVGIGTGIDNYTGTIGLSLNYRVYDKLFLQGGLGLGGWGNKSSIGVRYDLGYRKGLSFGLAYTHASGIREFRTELEGSFGEMKEVLIDLNKANTINVKGTYYFKVGRNNNFYMDLGYAIPLESSTWQVKDGSYISETSVQVLDMMSPGGLIFGLGFTFGVFGN